MATGVRVGPDSLVGTTAEGSVLTFDRAGRLYAAYIDGRFYRRGVDGRVVEKYTDSEPQRRTLAPAGAGRVVRKALALAAKIPELAGHGLIEDLDADAARFRAAYRGSVPVLPPDVYRALVLQATVGCAHNACRFCRLYRDRTHRVLPDAEFARHRDRVAAAFGAGISMRHGVFLGDADALAVGPARLARFCEAAHAVQPARDGIACFGSSFHADARHPREWDGVREAGLRRVHLGVETGDDALRRRLGKPGTGADVLRVAGTLKEAGIAVGLIFLLGIAGAGHIDASARLCRAAGLDTNDFVYLSPLVRRDGRLARGRRRDEERALRDAIGSGPRVAVYDIRTFVY